MPAFLLKEQVDISLREVELLAEKKGNLKMITDDSISKKLEVSDFPLGVPLFDGYSRCFADLMPDQLEIEYAALLEHH